MTKSGTQTFVEATIFEPAKNNFYAYHPLVIDAGTSPAAPTVVPDISDNAVIVYHFGTNANAISLRDTNNKTLRDANCVNGLHDNDLFGQFAYCNGPTFFNTVKNYAYNIPVNETGNDGQPCPTTRSFDLVDQDQSDNVLTRYILLKNGRTAQDTANNRLNSFNNVTVLSNPSDNVLLNRFVYSVLGCNGFIIPSLDDPGSYVSTLASDELYATVNQKQPVALVPPNDPMVLSNGQQSIEKTNLYRSGVGQPLINDGIDASGAAYCRNLGDTGAKGIIRQFPFTKNGVSPDANVGIDLFTFLSARFNTTWTILKCHKLIGIPCPIIPNVNDKGVTVSATYNGKLYSSKNIF
jgi:hypothetical protein